MENDFHERVEKLAKEFFLFNTLAGMPAEVLIDVLHQLAKKYQIKINEKDLGEQKLPENKRSWKRFQIWLDDEDTFEGGVYGSSEDSIEDAYNSTPRVLQIVAGIREVN